MVRNQAGKLTYMKNSDFSDHFSLMIVKIRLSNMNTKNTTH